MPFISIRSDAPTPPSVENSVSLPTVCARASVKANTHIWQDSRRRRFHNWKVRLENEMLACPVFRGMRSSRCTKRRYKSPCLHLLKRGMPSFRKLLV